jgi:hypothetical protein
VDGRYRGYFIVDLTRDRLQADFYASRTVQDRTTDERFVTGYATASDGNHLERVEAPAKSQSAPNLAP